MSFFLPFFASADILGQESYFLVEKAYSNQGEQRVKATLVKVGNGLYFYVEDNYWKSLSDKEKKEAFLSLDDVDSEFVKNIKPKLNSVFGTENTPGIDVDSKITVLFYSLKGNTRGYVRNIDGYSKINNPTSNEREMVYLNALHLKNVYLKEFLTHEYMHLITINQKERRIGGKSEDVWLSEALSEYAISYVGYNEKENSYIDNRINVFVNNPSDSLIDWDNQVADYGSVSIFASYFAEKYGAKVLADSLKSQKTGIDAINEALKSNGFKESFQRIFVDFTVASYLNDCAYSEKFCFKSAKLKDMHVFTLNNFLPSSGDSNIFLGQTLSNYSAQWQKFIGGKGDLKFKFKGTPSGFFSTYYVIKKTDGSLIVDYLKMPIKNQEGEVVIKGMGKDVVSIVFIPSVVTFFPVSENSKFYYSLSATTFVTSATQKLPIYIEKPLDQMTKEELINTLLRLLVYVMSQQPKSNVSSVIY